MLQKVLTTTTLILFFLSGSATFAKSSPADESTNSSQTEYVINFESKLFVVTVDGPSFRWNEKIYHFCVIEGFNFETGELISGEFALFCIGNRNSSPFVIPKANLGSSEPKSVQFLDKHNGLQLEVEVINDEGDVVEKGEWWKL